MVSNAYGVYKSTYYSYILIHSTHILWYYGVNFYADSSPSAWSLRQHGKNDTNLYNVRESVIFIEKSSSIRAVNKSQSRIRASTTSVDNADGDGGNGGSGSVREKRHPLLDRVKHTRLSCFKSSSSCSSLSDTSTSASASSSSIMQNSLNKLKLDSFNNNIDKVGLMKECHSENGAGGNGNLPKSSFLSTKVRAVSERYLQSSTNKFLAKLYKNRDRESGAFEQTTSSRSANKRRVRSKLRSFSYGALPGLVQFEENENRIPFLHSYDAHAHAHVLQDKNYNDSDRILLMDHEDSDSGVIVTDSVSCSSLFQNGSVGLNESNLKKNTLEDAKQSDTPNLIRNQQIIEYRKERISKVRKGFVSGRQSQLKSTQRKPTVLLIRLKKSSPDEELGILIARSKIHSGYIVRDIIPNSLAERYVAFKIT